MTTFESTLLKSLTRSVPFRFGETKKCFPQTWKEKNKLTFENTKKTINRK